MNNTLKLTVNIFASYSQLVTFIPVVNVSNRPFAFVTLPPFPLWVWYRARFAFSTLGSFFCSDIRAMGRVLDVL